MEVVAYFLGLTAIVLVRRGRVLLALAAAMVLLLSWLTFNSPPRCPPGTFSCTWYNLGSWWRVVTLAVAWLVAAMAVFTSWRRV